jgi:hypothetical protein
VSPVIETLRPRRGGPSTSSGRIAALQRSPLRACGHAERVCRGDVEPSGTLVLEQRVADGGASVQHRKDLERVAVPWKPVAGPELDERALVAELPEDPAEIGEE